MNDAFGLIQKYTGISRYSKSEVVTPQWIVSDMVDLLPADVFEPNSKFLDPAVKSGSFLVELHNRLMTSDAMKQAFPNEHDRHEHIIHNQLYGITTSVTAAIIVRKQLYDDFTIVGNIICTDRWFTKELVQGAFSNMKFDVVIGNPPYNSDIYLHFVTLGFQLSTKYTVMITPAKWQAKTDGKPKGSKTDDKNETFRKHIVPRMSKIVFYTDTTEIFSIGEWGGISYFLIDKDIHSTKSIRSICSKNSDLASEEEEHDETSIILLPRKILQIIGKVGQLGEGFKQSMYVKNTDHGESCLMGQLGFKQGLYVRNTDSGEPRSTVQEELKRQMSTEENDRGTLKLSGTYYVEVMQGERVSGYRQINDLFTTSNLDKWKCITSIIVSGSCSFDSSGYSQRYINIYKVAPYQVPKGSFPVLKYFDSEDEAKSFISYFDAKIIRFLTILGICGTTITSEFFRFVPDPKDWSCIYVDAPHAGVMPNSKGKYEYGGKTYCSLYVKYGLTPEEINIIESVIKERK